MGSIVKLLTMEEMVGSIGNIYRSVENLEETYITSNQAKNLLLNPTYKSPSKNALFLTGPSRTTETIDKFYGCNNSSSRPIFSSSSPFSSPPGPFSLPSGNSCSNYNTNVCYTSCPGCGGRMTSELRYVAPKSGKVVDEAEGRDAGFVKGVVTYNVMDDLTVTPMSSISGITLFNKFNVKDVSSHEECRVKLGINEVDNLMC